MENREKKRVGREKNIFVVQSEIGTFDFPSSIEFDRRDRLPNAL